MEKRLNNDLSKSAANAADADKRLKSVLEKSSEESSAPKEKAFANPMYNSEACPGRGSFGHYHQKMEVKEEEEEVLEEDGRYEEVDSGAYDTDLGREKGKDYHENYDFGENGIYQNILFQSKTERNEVKIQNGIKRNKSLRIACRIDEKDDDEKSNDERSSPILSDWEVEGETGRANGFKAKTLFTSSERRLVAQFLRSMNTETSIS